MILSRKNRVLLVVLVSVCLVSLALVFGLRKTVTLTVDGKSRTFTTYAFKVGDLLKVQHISLSPSDELSPALETWLKNGTIVSLQHAVPVQILADGVLTSLESPERVPIALLEQAGIKLRTGDVVLSNGRKLELSQVIPDGQLPLSLQLIRSVTFSLIENGKTKSISSTAPTLGSALWSAGYRLYASDQLTPTANTPLTDAMEATLTHARLVTIQTQAGNITLRSAATTVGEALEAAHLSLQGLDYSIPAAEDPIPVSGRLRLVRVTEQVLIEQTPLPFETEYQPADDLELDSQSVLQPGEYGITATRVRVRYEDGLEASRKVENEWVALQPKARIIGYGTAVVMHTTTVDGVTIQYWRSLSMYATSYHPSEVGDTTASGMPLRKGVAAVDTSVVPFYTQMYIPGYGEAVAADIGGGVIGRWIDLGYSDDDYVPWHSWVTVYFLWPPPDNIVWIVP